MLNFKDFCNESVFVSKEEIDTILDKIYSTGIESLSDIEKNRLTLFSENDREVIQTIEKMADITIKFKSLNKLLDKLVQQGEQEEAKKLFKSDWLKLNNELIPLEKLFKKWEIELGDYRLSRLMDKIRPDAYGNILD